MSVCCGNVSFASWLLSVLHREFAAMSRDREYPRLKILLAPGTPADIGTTSTIANRLGGIEYNFLDLEKPLGNLRILEFAWGGLYDVELWDVCGAHNYDEGMPPVCFMESSGMVVVSGEVPREILARNAGFFGSSDFPILWFVNEHTYRYSALETSISGLNITKAHFGGPTEEIVSSEFNAWLSKVLNYLHVNGKPM